VTTVAAVAIHKTMIKVLTINLATFGDGLREEVELEVELRRR